MVPYQQSVIGHIIKEEQIPEEEAQRRFDAMLQFLIVCAIANQPVSPSLPIDSAWHAFILHTRDYAHYCDEQFGRFIHHQPTADGERSQNRDNYLRARSIAEDLFGSLDAEMWPQRSRGAAACSDPDGECSGQCDFDIRQKVLATGDCNDTACHDDGHCNAA